MLQCQLASVWHASSHTLRASVASFPVEFEPAHAVATLGPAVLWEAWGLARSITASPWQNRAHQQLRWHLNPGATSGTSEAGGRRATLCHRRAMLSTFKAPNPTPSFTLFTRAASEVSSLGFGQHMAAELVLASMLVARLALQPPQRGPPRNQQVEFSRNYALDNPLRCPLVSCCSSLKSLYVCLACMWPAVPCWPPPPLLHSGCRLPSARIMLLASLYRR